MMNSKYLVSCVVGLILPIVGVSTSSAIENEFTSPTAASSANGSDAEKASPDGVSADWWNPSRNAIRQSERPNPAVAQARGPRVGWKAEGNLD